MFAVKGLQYDEIQDTQGWSALHRCAAYGDENDVLWLAKHNALPFLDRCTVKRRLTPLHVAALFDNVSTLEALVKLQVPPVSDGKGGEAEHVQHIINMVDSNGWSPLHAASANGAARTIEWLLRRGANVHPVTYETATWFPRGHEKEQFTALELVKRSGSEKAHRIFMETLQELAPGLEERDDDLFWDLEEGSDTPVADVMDEKAVLLEDTSG